MAKTANIEDYHLLRAMVAVLLKEINTLREGAGREKLVEADVIATIKAKHNTLRHKL